MSGSGESTDKSLLYGGIIGLASLAVAVGGVMYWLRTAKPRYEVYGQVLRAGRPIELDKCRITFLNLDKKTLSPATLDGMGKYRVSTYKESGLEPGKYSVVVSLPADYLPPTKSPTEALPPDELEKRLAKFIPRRFRDPATSGLTLEVIDQDVQFDVDMTD